MKQYVVTVAAGKRLIGKAMAKHPAVQAVLASGTLVIIAGTTNGYVAEEILAGIGQSEGFSRRKFVRGATFPSWRRFSTLRAQRVRGFSRCPARSSRKSMRSRFSPAQRPSRLGGWGFRRGGMLLACR